MRTFAQKPKPIHQTKSASSKTQGRGFSVKNHEVRSILHLQRTIGNQAVQRLLRSNEENRDDSLTSTLSLFAHDFSRIPMHDSARTNIHPKLKVSAPEDKYEQEADFVADQVLRMPEPDRPSEPKEISAVHHQTDSGKFTQCLTAHRSPLLADADDPERLPAKLIQRETVTDEPEGAGEPLHLGLRSFFIPRFGHDFGQVRIHTGAHATHQAQTLNARAFTYGNNIVFGNREYNPYTHRGLHLIAHELTHTAQQTGGAPHIIRKRTQPGIIQRAPIAQASNTLAARAARDPRRRFQAMYQQFRKLNRLTKDECRAINAFMQNWKLPSPCPFANNNRLNWKQKALLAGAMLAAAGVKGAHCGDWVMRVYQYSQGDPYISSRAWKRLVTKYRLPRSLKEPEFRWQSLAWSRTAVPPRKLTLIKPGCWVMYSTGSHGHSIVVTHVKSCKINKHKHTGTIELEAMESGWFSGVNIWPRYRKMTLNCGVFKNGRRIRKKGSIFSIQKPHRSRAYEKWLKMSLPTINDGKSTGAGRNRDAGCVYI